MIVEYAGRADRYCGPGVVHEVHAWWNVHESSERAVKGAARRSLFTQGGITDLAAFVSWDLCTYSHPQLNAVIRFRVLTPAELDRRTELRARRYTRCDGEGCTEAPGQLVYMFDDTTGNPERALCWACWRPLADAVQCKVLHWIDRDGKLSV